MSDIRRLSSGREKVGKMARWNCDGGKIEEDGEEKVGEKTRQ